MCIYVCVCLYFALKEGDQLGTHLFPISSTRFSDLCSPRMYCLQVVHQGTGLSLRPISQAGLHTMSRISPVMLEKKRKVLNFFKSYGLPLHVLSLIFDIFIMPSHTCFSESLPRICLGDSLLLTNLSRHRNPHPPLLDSPT